MVILNPGSRLDAAFAALADPTRRAILVRLSTGNADVSELMKPFQLSQPTISKHLNVLERAGLVACTRDAQRRPRTLVAVPLKEIADWLEPFRQFWEARFAGLDTYLRQTQSHSTTSRRATAKETHPTKQTTSSRGSSKTSAKTKRSKNVKAAIKTTTGKRSTAS